MSKLRLNIPIVKVDEERREVIGRATREEIDSDKEIVEFEGSKRAFSKWTREFEKKSDGLSLGNIREMHRAWAAGKVTAWEADEEDQSIVIATKIVDDAAWEKCKERVYTMFSIGGDPTRERREMRNGVRVNVIKDYTLNEVSLVDNGAAPSATFSVVKMDGSCAVPMGLRKMQELLGHEVADEQVADAIEQMAEEFREGGPVEKCRAVIKAVYHAAHEVAEELAQGIEKGTLEKPAALESCVQAVMAEGHDEDSAWAICQASQKEAAAGASPDDITKAALKAAGKQAVHKSAGEPKPDPEPEVLVGIDPAAAEDRQITGVVFHVEHFDEDKARRYLVNKGYFRLGLSKSEDGKQLVASQLLPGAEVEQAREVKIGTGITATTGVVKADPRGPFRKVLSRARSALTKSMMTEGGSIFAAMRALTGIVEAIESELFPVAFSTDAVLPDEEKQAVIGLTAAAESILEFMAGEFQQQLAAVTGTAKAAGLRELEQLADVALVRRRPILKQVDGEDAVDEPKPEDVLMENLGKIHEIGHSLMAATTEMGASCKEGSCKAAADGEEDQPPADGEDGATPPPDGGEAPTDGDGGDGGGGGDGGSSEGDGSTPPPSPDDEEAKRGKAKAGGDLQKVLTAVGGVGQKVDALGKRLDGFDERLKRTEARPDDVGRRVRRVDKTIGGVGGEAESNDPVTPEACERLAAETNDMTVKEHLIRKASMLRIKKLQAGG